MNKVLCPLNTSPKPQKDKPCAVSGSLGDEQTPINDDSIISEIPPQRHQKFLVKEQGNVPRLHFVKRTEADMWIFYESTSYPRDLKLKDLALTFHSAKVIKEFRTGLFETPPREMIYLGESLKRHASQLQKVEFGFMNENARYMANMNKIVCQNLKEFKCLQSLNLFFYACSVNSELLKDLGNCLKRLRTLKDLTLKFQASNIFGQTDQLFHGLKTLTSLKSLYLDFAMVKGMDSASMLKIGDCLKRMTCLETMIFKCCGSDLIGDIEIRAICQGLKSSKSSLKILHLESTSCPRMNNAALLEIADCLRTLTSLQNLKLHLPDCRQIGDAGLFSLGLALQNLESLQKICLGLWQCYEITDAGVIAIRDGLKQQKLLENLEISFSNCNKITNVGRNEMKSYIEGRLELFKKDDFFILE